ncbi:MAG TPA: hypothetical protein VKQ34_04065 [Candidatus Saccharimonadales bacterium]|nr:hypothetical protein [Candidatus Saccharimonadales bacterium]
MNMGELHRQPTQKGELHEYPDGSVAEVFREKRLTFSPGTLADELAVDPVASESGVICVQTKRTLPDGRVEGYLYQFNNELLIDQMRGKAVRMASIPGEFDPHDPIYDITIGKAWLLPTGDRAEGLVEAVIRPYGAGYSDTAVAEPAGAYSPAVAGKALMGIVERQYADRIIDPPPLATGGQAQP